MSVGTDTTTLLHGVAGTSLAILGILIGAAIVNRLARRAVKRGLSKLGSGGLRERLGPAGIRTPAALTDTGDLTPRSPQRIEALATVLGSGASFCLWWGAIFLGVGQVRIDL